MTSNSSRPPPQTGNSSSDRFSSISSANKYMLDAEDGCDLTLLVRGPSDRTEVKIAVHRYVLSSRSPEFYQLLWVGKANKEKKLKISDSSAEAMKQLVRFLYCDEASLTASNVIEVLSAARRYKVPLLGQLCKDFIITQTTASNVCTTLEQCLALSEAELVSAILRYISLNTPAVLCSEAFLHSTPEVVRRIVSHDELDIAEVELFEACVSWARLRCTTGNRGADSASADLVRCYLEPIVPHIRFPTMSPEEFATRVVPLDVLTDNESCNIFKYYSCPSKPPKRFMSILRSRPNIAHTTIPVPLSRQTPFGSDEDGIYPDVRNLRIGEMKPTAPLCDQAYACRGAPPIYEQ